MVDPFGERSKRVAALAGRLRTLQAELADEEPKVREEQLSAVLEQALTKEQSHDVSGFMDELMTWFPSGNGEASPAAAPTPAVRAKAPEPKSASEWADGLVKAWASLPESERSVLTGKLVDGGVIQPSPAGSALPPQVEQELRTKFQMQPAEKVDPAKVQALASMLSDFVMRVDRLAWTAWSQRLAGPATDVRSSGPIQRYMKNFVMGTDAGLPGLGLGPELQRLQQLTGALVGGIAEAGKNYAETWFSQLSPGVIKESVGTSAFRNEAVECWKVYEARAGAMDKESIQREIRQAVARFVEDLMKRTR